MRDFVTSQELVVAIKENGTWKIARYMFNKPESLRCNHSCTEELWLRRRHHRVLDHGWTTRNMLTAPPIDTPPQLVRA